MNHVPYASICIFINKDNNFLIIKRSEDLKTFPGVWAFPGGKIDDGEDPVDAAIREAKEEVGLDFTRYNCRYIWSDMRPNGREICFFIIRNWEGNVELNEESTKWGWFNLDDLRYLRMIPVPNELTDRIKNFINNIYL